MRTFTRFIISLVSVLTITSCQFTEKININDDGSGTYALRMDMSAMMSAMDDMNSPDSTKVSEKETEVPEVIDTIMNFRDILEEKKDSIDKLSKEDQEKIEALKDLKIRLAVNETENIAFTDFIFEFKAVEELKDIQESITKAQSIKDNKEEQTPQPTRMLFSFDGKTFKRKVIENDLTEEEKEAYKKSMEGAASFMDGSTYKIEYHFPRPIKSTTYKGATFSEDRKTIFIEIGMKKMTENPKLLDFEVELE